jgi:hypothetical protein
LYKTIYNNICERGQLLKEKYGPKSGIHKHHIIPKHMNGNDNEDNFTYLSVREHKIAHFLLWKIYGNPNDLRAMRMLGANLTPRQRQIIGEWCRDNKIGYHNTKWNNHRHEWIEKALQTQKKSYEETGNKDSFYYWSTPEGRKERARMGNKKAILSQKKSYEETGNKDSFYYWSTPEGRKERARMGAKAIQGRKVMHKPGDVTFKRVKPELVQQYLSEGYIFGSPISPWNKSTSSDNES